MEVPLEREGNIYVLPVYDSDVSAVLVQKSRSK